MIERIKRYLKSKNVQALLAFVGFGGMIVTLLALALPSGSEITRWAAIVYLCLLGICAAVLVLRIVVHSLLDRLVVQIRSEINDQTSALKGDLDTRLGQIENRVQESITLQRSGSKRELESLEARLRDLPPSAENAYRYSAERYGIGYGFLEVECTIRRDGSATVKRKVKAEAYTEVGELDTCLLIPEPAPEDRTWDIDFVRVKTKTIGRTVSLNKDKTVSRNGVLTAYITISPPLAAGDSVTYEMTEELPAGLYAFDFTKEELAKRHSEYDYFGWNIIRPVRKLSLRVFFPDGFKPNVYGHEVRYASAASGFPSVTTHHEEQQKLERPTLEGPEGNRYILQQDVPCPMVRLVYILRWRPIPKDAREEPPEKGTEAQSLRIAPPSTVQSAVIRNLILDSFTAQELKEFCQDRPVFRPALRKFGPKSTMEERVDALLEFSEKRVLIQTLLSEIQSVNPRQYERYEEQFGEGNLLADDDPID
ncbi:MAG: hypothetical protein PVJ34_15915 [Anaerolineae bacterium]|jgi:hypothetical protein